MDEAASSLDATSANYLNSLLLQLKEKSQTMLLITHRKQGVSMADKVLNLENGQLK